MMTNEEVVAAFTANGKLASAQTMRVAKLQKTFLEAATDIMDLCPENSDRTAALRILLQAKMMAVQSVTHSKEFSEKEKPNKTTV